MNKIFKAFKNASEWPAFEKALGKVRPFADKLKKYEIGRFWISDTPNIEDEPLPCLSFTIDDEVQSQVDPGLSAQDVVFYPVSKDGWKVHIESDGIIKEIMSNMEISDGSTVSFNRVEDIAKKINIELRKK